MKNIAQKNCRKMFLEAIFSHSKKHFFQSFRTNVLSLLYMISLAYKISHCLSTNHYPELRCVICTGVTLFALVLHLNCTAPSQSESSNFFMCIIRIIIKFLYNARSDWLKQRALSENRAQVDDGKLAFKFLLRNFDKFDLN